MPQQPAFNYIITIHNKEDLIQDVVISALLCCRDNSRVYAVLDGCTDETEKIIDGLTDQFEGLPLQKVFTNDVHELLSINAGLRAAPQNGFGFNIILQDDVILADRSLERKITRLYQWGGEKLGYVSLRLGANFERDAATSGNPIPLTAYLESAYGHALPDAEVLLPGRFAYRTVPIKSPVCLPFHIVREIGLLNEDLAPYAHDDTDLAIRLVRAGYFNGVFPLRFYSDVKWGGTRTAVSNQITRMQARNMGIIRDRLGADLNGIASGDQRRDVVEFPEFVDAEMDRQALQQYEATKQAAGQADTSISGRLRGRLKRAFASLSTTPKP